ncbi:hypothetical protein KR51_00012460, partial [Rubidibacter lacunae KORDI 51-2]
MPEKCKFIGTRALKPLHLGRESEAKSLG